MAAEPWTNTAGGSWTGGANWAGGAAPLAGDDVVIGLRGLAGYAVSLPNAAYSLKADLEDRYETRLRGMLDAKLRGEGVLNEADAPAAASNVVDIMAALRASLGEVKGPPAAKKGSRRASPDLGQIALKLPIKGGKTKPVADAEPVPARVKQRA